MVAASCSETATRCDDGLDIPALRQHLRNSPGALLSQFSGGEGWQEGRECRTPLGVPGPGL